MSNRSNRRKSKQSSSPETVNHKLSPLASAVKVAIVGLGMSHGALQAATIEVDSNLDTNPLLEVTSNTGVDPTICSLRDAIVSINDGVLQPGCTNTGAAFGTDDTINIADALAGETFDLENFGLAIGNQNRAVDVTLNGSGITVINRTNYYQLAFPTAGAVITVNVGAAASIDNITLQAEGRDQVLLVTNESTVSVNNSVITGGGGVTSGGGVQVTRGSSAAITNSSITGNSADISYLNPYGVGGGISVSNAFASFSSSSLTLVNSTVSDNVADTIGGGISASGFVNIINSTISNNTAASYGGGISASNLNLTNSTVSGNSASGASISIYDSQFRGDASTGIAVTGVADISNSTVAANEFSINRAFNNGLLTPRVGSAIGVGAYSSNALSITNSIVSSTLGDSSCNTFSNFGNPVTPSTTSDTASIITDNGDCAVQARDIDPILLPLADNGCTTMHATLDGPACVMTHALASNSPAIDAGVGVTLATDQIGTPRPQGAAADVGAVEFTLTPPSDPGFTVTAVDAVEGVDINVLFTISLNEPQSTETVLAFNTVAGTATDGEDYNGRVGRVTFPAGVTVQQRRVRVLEDGVPNEPDETFSLVVTDINDPTASVTTQATIVDSNNTVTLPTITAQRMLVPEESERAVVEVLLSEPFNEQIIVDFATAVANDQPNPATSGVDYIDIDGRIVFPAGVTRRTRTITLIDDDEIEGNEVINFDLSNPINAVIGAGSDSRQIVIVSDDPVADNNDLPVLTVPRTFATEGDGFARVEVLLSEASTEQILVDFRTFVPTNQNNPATSGVDYIDRSGTIVFPPGVTRRTRTMTVIDDNDAEPNEAFRFELSNPRNAEIADDGSSLQRVFILNDD